MSLAYAVSDAQVMVTRSTRRALRDPEAFFTALTLPIVLMLLFVYVFGSALNAGSKYVDYVVPGLIVLCAAFGAGATAVARRHRHVQRHRGPVPIHADRGLVDPDRAHRREPGPQPDRDHPGYRRRPAASAGGGSLRPPGRTPPPG